MVTDYKHGGYNLDDNEIGVALMAAAVFQLLWQVIYRVISSHTAMS